MWVSKRWGDRRVVVLGGLLSCASLTAAVLLPPGLITGRRALDTKIAFE